MVQACKFYLQSRCQRGKHCRYRHGGAGVPLATAIRQPPTVPEFAPGTITAVLDGSRAVFTDGFTPVHIQLSASCPTKIQSLDQILQVSWYKPTRPIWLIYQTRAQAEQAISHLHFVKPHSTILTATIKLSRDGTSCAVELSGDDGDLTLEELHERLPSELRTADVVFGKLTYPAGGEDARIVRTVVEDHTVAKIAREDEPMTKGELMNKAVANYVFEGHPDLGWLAKSLDRVVAPGLGRTTIFANVQQTLVLRLRRDALHARYQEYKKVVSRAWQESKVKIVKSETNGNEAPLSLYAAARSELATVKRSIDEMVGQPDSVCLRGILSGQQTHRIRLTTTAAYKDAKHAFDETERLFGKDVVSFDNGSDPPAILVKGDSIALRRVQKHLRGDAPAPKRKTRTCRICLDDKADEFMKLDGCEHAACTSCLTAYCMTDRDSKFPLICFEQGCRQHLSLRQVSSLLEGPQLKVLLAEAIRDHVRRHSNEFAQCPGTDCSRIHHKSTPVDMSGKDATDGTAPGADGTNPDDNTSDMLSNQGRGREICHECLIDYCTSCIAPYTPHIGISCDEYQRKVAVDREFTAWMETNEAKQCPKCSAVITKNEGCNAMDCATCGGHFCWHCLEQAPSHDALYVHMTEKHGRWFDNERDEMDHILAGMAPGEAALNGIANVGGELVAMAAEMQGLRQQQRQQAHVRPGQQQGFVPARGNMQWRRGPDEQWIAPEGLDDDED